MNVRLKHFPPQVFLFVALAVVVAIEAKSTSHTVQLDYSHWKYANKSVGVCVDFHGHVCGRFTRSEHGQKQELLDASDQIKRCQKASMESDSKTKSIAVKYLKQFRKQFKKEQKKKDVKATELHQEANKLGSFPVLTKNWNANKFNLTDALFKYTELTTHVPFFDFDLQYTSSGFYELVVRPSDMSETFPFLDVEDENQEFAMTDKVTRELVFGVLKYMCKKSKLASHSLCRSDQHWKNAVSDFGIVLSKLYNLNKSQKSQKSQKTTNMTVKQLSDSLPIVGPNFFTHNPLISPELRSHLLANHTIRVENKEYFVKLNELLSQLNKETLANFLCISYLLEQLPGSDFDIHKYVSKDVVDELENLDLLEKDDDDTYNYKSNAEFEEKRKEKFPLVVDHLFVRDCVKESDLRRVEEIAANVHKHAVQMVEKNTWVDKKDLSKVLQKIKSTKIMIGGVDTAVDQQKLDKYYETLNFSPHDKLRVLEQKLALFEKQKELDVVSNRLHMLGEIKRRSFDINAYHAQGFNTVVYLSGYMFPPNFDPNMSISAQYGTVGKIIGHEIFHGLDSKGVFYGVDGRPNPVLGPVSLAKFNEANQCLIDQFNASYDKETNLYTNGAKTLGENIADLAGSQAAFLAHEEYLQTNVPANKHLAAQQEFFFGYTNRQCSNIDVNEKRRRIQTDVHASDKDRATETLKNMPEFAKAFNCRRGSPMNPVKKCHVW